MTASAWLTKRALWELLCNTVESLLSRGDQDDCSTIRVARSHIEGMRSPSVDLIQILRATLTYFLYMAQTRVSLERGRTLAIFEIYLPLRLCLVTPRKFEVFVRDPFVPFTGSPFCVHSYNTKDFEPPNFKHTRWSFLQECQEGSYFAWQVYFRTLLEALIVTYNKLQAPAMSAKLCEASTNFQSLLPCLCEIERLCTPWTTCLCSL